MKKNNEYMFELFLPLPLDEHNFTPHEVLTLQVASLMKTGLKSDIGRAENDVNQRKVID